MKSKFTTKIASLVLALVIIFSLTSCSFGFNNPKDDPIDTPKDDSLAAVDSSLADDTHGYSFVYLRKTVKKSLSADAHIKEF